MTKLFTLNPETFFITKPVYAYEKTGQLSEYFKLTNYCTLNNLGIPNVTSDLSQIPNSCYLVINRLQDLGNTINKVLEILERLLSMKCTIYVAELNIIVNTPESVILLLKEFNKVKKLKQKLNSDTSLNGRPRKPLKANKTEILKLYSEGKLNEAIKLSGVSKTTFYKHLNEWNVELVSKSKRNEVIV